MRLCEFVYVHVYVCVCVCVCVCACTCVCKLLCMSTMSVHMPMDLHLSLYILFVDLGGVRVMCSAAGALDAEATNGLAPLVCRYTTFPSPADVHPLWV